jgi:hypothetical protein
VTTIEAMLDNRNVGLVQEAMAHLGSQATSAFAPLLGANRTSLIQE